MTTPVRHVRRATFRVQREEHATRARTLLEDALRTASIDDEDRVLIVRSLRLGQLPLQAGATTWSLRLEDRLRQLRDLAVDPDSPAAARAHVVCFPGRNEPWVRLALRTARGQPCNEWFWVRAAQGWTSQFSPTETLRLAFTRLAAAGGLAATLALAQRMGDASELGPLLEALQPTDLMVLFPSTGPAPPAAPPTRVDDYAAPGSAWPTFLRNRIADWGPDDRRSWWVAAVAFAKARPAAPLPTALQARALAHQFLESRLAAAPDDPSITRAHRDRVARKPSRPTGLATTPQSPPESAPPTYPNRSPTAAGGLFFLVALLARGGLAEWLNRHPAAAGLPWRILHLALRHARTPGDDPLAIGLPALPSAFPGGLAWRRLLDTHRSGRRLTGLPLRALIVRPGLVSLTETHIDVFFRAKDADVRIRRAGLDLDPGWVPWLRRVVSFHFNRED